MDDFKRIKKMFRKNRAAMISSGFLVILFIIALIGPFVTQHPGRIDYELKGIPRGPSLKHFFGTDAYGRDVFTRTVHGAGITLIVSVLSVLIFVIIGSFFGAVSGYFGGVVDSIIMRIVDVMLSLPLLFFILAIQLILKPSIWNVIIVIGLTGWAGTCRLVRGQVLSVREMTFVEGAKAIGASHMRIITKHILPNVMAPIIVNGTLGIASTILLESVLSFLGFGVQEPLASWGSMLHRSQSYMTIAPWTVFFPGAMIVLTVLAFNFLGDGLRDALDPKLKR